MKKFNTRPIDFTGCHPVIAGALKRGEAIECRVWDHRNHEPRVGLVVGFAANNEYPYRCDYVGSSIYRHAEPIPIKVRRIMPPERAIPALIADGWRYDENGVLLGDPPIIPPMFKEMGGPVDNSLAVWPSCIIEEVEDDE